MSLIAPDAAVIRDVLNGKTTLGYSHSLSDPLIRIFPNVEEDLDHFGQASVHLDDVQSKRLSNLLLAYENTDTTNWLANRQTALKSFYIANLPANASMTLFS